MKKAKSLLAIWLALILVLAFAPTAWADGLNISLQYDSESISSPTQSATTWQTGDPDVTISFTLVEGYENPTYDLTIGGTAYTGTEVTLTEANGTYTLTIPASVITGDVAVSLKAAKKDDVPTPLGTVYEITFTTTPGLTGVTGMPDPATLYTQDGGKLTIPSTIPTLDGHTFMGWYDGATHSYAADQEVTFTKDTTLTATLLRNLTITYEAASGDTGVTGLPAAQTDLAPESEITLSSEIPTRPGYTFAGWKVQGSSDGKVYAAGSTLTLPRTVDVTLEATWTNATVTISFEKGTSASVGGMPSSNMEVEADKTFTAPKAPIRTGSYAFTGWKASWNGKVYKAGATVTAPTAATGTMTAQWSKVYYPDWGDDDDSSSSGSSSGNTYYSIDVSCSSGGYVSPSGTTSVKKGNSLTVTWSPKSGYVIDGVYIDGVLDNSHDGSYTFRNVTSSHTLYVRYVRDTGSSGSGSGSGSDTSPKTGDSSLPLSVVLGAGALALATLFIARKRIRA